MYFAAKHELMRKLVLRLYYKPFEDCVICIIVCKEDRPPHEFKIKSLKV